MDSLSIKLYGQVDIYSKIESFCEASFRSPQYSIETDSLSEFNEVYRVFYNNKKYIVKHTAFYNPISLIRANKQFAESIYRVTKQTHNHTKRLALPEYLRYEVNDFGVFYLMHETQLKRLPPEEADLVMLGEALSEFHISFTNNDSGMIILPWNHFSPEFRAIFVENKRWDVVSSFLKNYYPGNEYFSNNLIVNHNDIHAGNIFLSNSRYMFLDLNEISLADPLNDLGIIVANYIINPTIEGDELDNKLSLLLSGYYRSQKMTVSTKQRQMIYIFALRKLFLIEGYFLYSGYKRNNYNTTFIQWLRDSQSNITKYIEKL